jgi:hypothetical protein
MSDGAMPVSSSEQSESQACRRGITRPFRLIVLALAGTALISALLVIPGWIPTLSRSVRRELTEVILQSVVVVYLVIVVGAVCGALSLAWLLARSFRRRAVRTGIVRLSLAGGSCLVGFFFLEFGAAAWHAWMHRFPDLPTRFVASPPAEYRIVVLGGSSAAGEPYWPWLSVGQIVTWRLAEAVADRRFQCEILAYPGDSLEMQHHKLAALKHRPDAVIIYAGHNEFVARFEEEREGWQDGQTATPIARMTQSATATSSFCSLAYEIISKNRLDRPPSLALRHEIIDPPVCSHVEWAAIRDDFHRRLETIVSYCDQINALPILIIPPANESGYEPGRSSISPLVPANERRRLVDEISAARACESTEPGSSEVRYRAILERHPDFAEAHFRLARLLERSGRATAAAPHYLAALDHDGLPLRCPAPFRSALIEVARRHPRAVLIDGRRELIEISPDGLIGDQLIHDTHHPTLPGYVALAAAVLRQLDRCNVFASSRVLAQPLDATECAAHFGMNAEKWADVCDRVSQHFKRVAGYRYDPAERLEKSRRYAEAARRIWRGDPVGDLGLPVFPGQLTPGLPQGFRIPHSDVRIASSLPITRARSFGDDFYLPVLQVDHCAPAEESDDGHELIALRPADHLAEHAGQRSRRDPHGRSDGHRVFRRDRQAGAQHGVNLPEIFGQRLLIDYLDYADQPVGAQGSQSGRLISLQEHISHEERHYRLQFPPLGRVTLLANLGQVVDKPLGFQVASRRLLLARFRM